MGKLEVYNKNLDYSYALGIYPALGLLESRPQSARRLLLNPAGLEHEGVELLRQKCAAMGVREEMAERVLRREARKDNCFAGLVFEKYQDELQDKLPHLVLCQVSDGGNLGSIMRSCVGFGVKDVAIIRPAVDAFDPKVIRASMGAAFKLRLAVYDRFEDYRERHPSHALYPFMLDGFQLLARSAAEPYYPYALVFGNEQSGLHPSFQKRGTPTRIPQSEEIDSLNLAVSVSVGLYAFTEAHKPGYRSGEHTN